MSGYFLFIHINEWATPESPDSIPISQAFALAYLRRYGFTGQILGDYKNALAADHTQTGASYHQEGAATRPVVTGHCHGPGSRNRGRTLYLVRAARRNQGPHLSATASLFRLADCRRSGPSRHTSHPMTKAAYQSICRDYATTTMTAAEIHQLRLF